MKFSLTALFILLSNIILFAQSDGTRDLSKIKIRFNDYQDVCGSYVEESQMYFQRTGKITKVLNGNTVIFAQDTSGGNLEKGQFTVTLAGIDTTGNDSKIKKFLIKELLNKNVTILGNTEEDTDTSFFGIIWHRRYVEGEEMNRHIIQNGMAKFTEPGYEYSVSYVTMCIYEQLEEKAKKEKLGIWAK